MKLIYGGQIEESRPSQAKLLKRRLLKLWVQNKTNTQEWQELLNRLKQLKVSEESKRTSGRYSRGF